MQIFILLLVMAIFVHDAEGVGAVMSPIALASVVVGPKLALALVYAVLCRLTFRRLNGPNGRRWLMRLDRAGIVYRLLVLGSYALDLSAGLLVTVRRELADMILLDELLVMAGPLLMLTWSWWCFYPIDRRLREATLMRRIDEGAPIHPIWTRGQYLLRQWRHQVALLFVPLMALLAWIEILVFYAPTEPAYLSQVLTLLGAVVVFVLTPAVMRRLWDTTPLPDGELRRMLLDLCRSYRVRVRELLLWRTFGCVVNAAVMGFIRPFRYILLSDALLDHLPKRQVEAVMAHELAHVRKHHMIWLGAAAIGAAGLLELGGYGLWWLAMQWLAAQPTGRLAGVPDSTISAVVASLLLATVGGIWLLVFGWVSRRFERQADTFAVQHLATRQRRQTELPEDTPHAPLIDAASAAAMIGALEQVALLNQIPAIRPSWRHGSIAWRQAHLRRLIGERADNLSIDRQVRRINIAAVTAVVAVVAIVTLL